MSNANAARPRNEQPDPVETLREISSEAKFKVWNSPDGHAHVSLLGKGREVHHPVDAPELRSHLRLRYYRKRKAPLPNGALEHFVQLLQAKADDEGTVHEPFVRFGFDGPNLYLDLCDERGRMVEVSASGARVLGPGDPYPVRFVRPRGSLPLPVPNLGAAPDALLVLRDVFRLAQDAFVLLLAFLVGCANTERVYPLLVLRGGQGTGKSTLARSVRRLIDPRSVPLATLPSSERDLMVVAMETHLLVYDNLSGMKDWLSDAFCRLATGGGLLIRSLFTNRGVERFSKTAPVVLNGIDDVATRNDLASRAIEIELRPVPPAERKSLRDIEARFEAAQADMLGALCNAWSTALARRDRVTLKESPRMIDFARWVKAAEPALPLAPGEFERVYRASIDASAESNVENDPVASAVFAFMAEREVWEGGVKDLLMALAKERLASDLSRMNARGVASALRRAAPALERVGVSVHVDPSKKDPKTRRQTYTLTRRP